MVEDAVPLNELRRALVIKLRHHGDVLLTSPVFSTLQAHAPQVEMDALIYADTAPMLQGHPAVARLHTIDRHWKSLGPFTRLAREGALLAALRQRRYDLVVHLTDHPRGAWVARLTGARWAVAPRVPARGKAWRRAFTHLYAEFPRTGRHAVERNLDALRRIGLQPAPTQRRLTLVPGTAAQEQVARLLAAHGVAQRGYVHLHPASRWLFKCWPAAATATLIDALYDRGLAVVVTAAPDAREQALVADILAACKARPLDLSGQLPLPAVAALSAGARLFVGADTAPMHMAAAVGTPVVAWFGPSSETDWAPWMVPHRIVASPDHPCRPCGLDGCGGGKISDCLVRLPADRVLAAVDELLAQTRVDGGVA